jgi:hypothetical protein
MCETHGNINEIAKGAKDSNGYTKCRPGKHAEGTKKGKNGGQVRNCVPNESVAETALNPQDPAGDYAAKRKALQDLGMNKAVDQKAVLQRRLDLDREAKAKGVAEGPEYNEYSDEVDMVENNLLTIIRACKELADTLKAGENLPEWVEEKISMSKQNMVTVSEYLQSQHDQGHIYDEDHSTATGGWGQEARRAIDIGGRLSGAGHDDRTMEGYFGRLQEKLDAEVDERSKSRAQWDLMHAVAHNPAFAKKVGVKQSVGKEFSVADTGHNRASLPKRILPKKKK